MSRKFNIMARLLLASVWVGISLLGANGAAQNSPYDFHSKFHDGLSPQQVAAGWISLFDGQSMYGWRNSAGWKVESGVIVADQKNDTILRTGVQFDDYELRLEYWANAESQTSLLLRTSPKPGTDDAYSFDLQAGKNRQDKWREFRVVVNEGQLESSTDSEPMETITEATNRKGYIGFRHNGGKIRIRNVHLRPLNLLTIFNGKDLDGWDDSQKMESKFQVVDECLQMLGGRGQLETKDKFGDFILSLQARTNSDGLNSGLFFRCIPGDVMNGYESQISNLVHESDPARPQDCGTGGIFRRQNARIVNAKDQAWFAKTIVADGGTICVWINGSLVCDWTDRRKPHDNPRKGQRLKPGTVILQGHDPTTDINFRNIAARELNQRRN